MTDATASEIMRRLDEVARQLSELATQMREDRTANAKLFLPREFYAEARKADQALIADVAGDVDDIKMEQRRNADYRRQVGLGFALTSITVFITLGIAVSNFVGR